MKNFTFPFKNKIKKSNPKAGFLIIVLALGCQKVQRLSYYQCVVYSQYEYGFLVRNHVDKHLSYNYQPSLLYLFVLF